MTIKTILAPFKLDRVFMICRDGFQFWWCQMKKAKGKQLCLFNFRRIQFIQFSWQSCLPLLSLAHRRTEVKHQDDLKWKFLFFLLLFSSWEQWREIMKRDWKVPKIISELFSFHHRKCLERNTNTHERPVRSISVEMKIQTSFFAWKRLRLTSRVSLITVVDDHRMARVVCNLHEWITARAARRCANKRECQSQRGNTNKEPSFKSVTICVGRRAIKSFPACKTTSGTLQLYYWSNFSFHPQLSFLRVTKTNATLNISRDLLFYI